MIQAISAALEAKLIAAQNCSLASYLKSLKAGYIPSTESFLAQGGTSIVMQS